MPNLTEISFNGDQFGTIILLALVLYFFWVGYFSDKRSGGIFMIMSGMWTFALEYMVLDYVSATLVIPLISPLAIVIVLLGILKFLYHDHKKDEG